MIYLNKILRFTLVNSLLLTSLLANAQTDSISIRQQILDYPATTDFIIFKGRQYLANQLEKNHLDTVKMVMEYLDAEINGLEYQSFMNVERVLLYYHTRQYDRLKDFIMKFDSLQKSMYYPTDKQIYEIAVQQSIRNFDILNNWIDESDRSNEDKCFMKLLLVSFLPDTPVGISKKKNEDNMLIFCDLYPNSAYNGFIRKYVTTEYGLSDFGCTIGLGGGYPFFSNKNFDLNWGIMFNFGFIYKRWQLDLACQGSFGKLAQDMPVENWLKDKNFGITSICFSLGYSVFDNKRWRVTPFGGFAYNQVSAGKTEENNKTVKAYSPQFGMDFDLKLNPWHSYIYTTSTVAYANLRINYLPATFNNAGKIWSGSMLLVTMSIAFDFHYPKRIY